jgi:hypothetical protein
MQQFLFLNVPLSEEERGIITCSGKLLQCWGQTSTFLWILRALYASDVIVILSCFLLFTYMPFLPTKLSIKKEETC